MLCLVKGGRKRDLSPSLLGILQNRPSGSGGRPCHPSFLKRYGRHYRMVHSRPVGRYGCGFGIHPWPYGGEYGYLCGIYHCRDPWAVIATLGLITPSIIVILVIAGFLKSFRNNRFVNSVFVCLRPASTGLIVASGLSVAAVTFFGVSDLASITMEAVRAFDWKALVLAVILLVLTRWIKPTKKLHPIVWILCSAVVGVAFSFAGV